MHESFVRNISVIVYIAGALGLTVVEFHHIEPNLRRIAELAAMPFRPAAPPAAPSVVVTAAPPVIAEAQKKAEPVTTPMVCVDAISHIIGTIKGDSGKFEPKFNVIWRGRDTCFTLTLMDVGTVHLRFETKTAESLSPTFHVKPRVAADLKDSSRARI